MTRPHYSERNARPAPLSGRTGLGLALGGGFSRGFAHLGVLRVLEQNHIPVSYIAGTSVGSILGAAYASGAPLARIIATCRTIRFRDIARWRVSRLGLASNHRLSDLIERVSESRRFEDLKIHGGWCRRTWPTASPSFSPTVICRMRSARAVLSQGSSNPFRLAPAVSRTAASSRRFRRAPPATSVPRM